MKAGFTFTGAGTFRRVETFTTKAGKAILTAIVEIPGQYPQTIPFKVFGRLADSIRELRDGDIVEISGRLGGRSWNGKVFGENVAEVIEVIAAGAPTENSAPSPSDDDIPF